MASTHDYVKDSRNDNIKIYINGEYYRRSEAKISVFDSGFLLGDGVWEGIRLHNNKLIHLETHIDRLFTGAKSIAMEIHLSKEEIINAIWSTLKENNMKSDTHIRLIVSRGIKSTPYQHPKVTISTPTIVIIPEYKKPNKDVIDKGIRLVSVQTRRDSAVQDPKINSLSKMNCISACIEAESLGAEEGLMFDPHGFVSTCNSTNFFIVVNNDIWTSTGEYCLNGVTRGTIINLCKENNMTVYEKNFLIQDVYNADEAFVTGTFADVVKDSPAEDAGMQEGDVIVEFNGKPIANTANLKNVVSLTAPESTNRVKVIRNGSPKTVKVTLQELPENPQQYAIRQRNESNEFGLELKKITDSLKEKYQIEEEEALVVTRIDPNGEAYGKGIREGDIIKRIGTERVRSLKDYNRLLEKAKVKGTVLVLVKKPGGSSRYYTLSYQ